MCFLESPIFKEPFARQQALQQIAKVEHTRARIRQLGAMRGAAGRGRGRAKVREHIAATEPLCVKASQRASCIA